MHSGKAAWWTVITVVVLVTSGLTPGRPAEAQQGQWVIAWGSSMQGLAPTTLTNATIQMIARPTIAGDLVRIKIENTFSSQPLAIGAAYIALRNYQASLVAGSNRQLTFDGLPYVTIPAQGLVHSDPVALTVTEQQDLAISLYVPETSVSISRHVSAFTTSYLTPNGAGNHAASENRSAFTIKTTNMLLLSAVEVFSISATGAIIAFGDSITNGTCSTVDAHNRWEDILALRLLMLDDNSLAVVNEGISGDTLTKAKKRLNRDVLTQNGVTHVILFMGTNDINGGASAAQVIAGQQEVIGQVRATGRKIIGVTLIARAGWNNTKTTIRSAVNNWILTQADFDAVLDFDAVVRDHTNPNLLNPTFNCDGIHPNPSGYFAMGLSIVPELLWDPHIAMAVEPASE
jgi:lysophospholipase L1-like esterase